MKDLIFVTGNESKVKYVSQWLGIPLQHQKVDLPELQTLDVREVTGEKALAAYRHLEKSVLVEDVSLACPAMGRLPGTFIKFFEQELGLEKFCRMMNTFEDRTAIVTCCYALFDGNELHFFEGEMHGSIVDAPRGTRGFGFDFAFINDGFSITRGEMNEEDYANTSARKAALQKLAAFLKQK